MLVRFLLRKVSNAEIHIKIFYVFLHICMIINQTGLRGEVSTHLL